MYETSKLNMLLRSYQHATSFMASSTCGLPRISRRSQHVLRPSLSDIRVPDMRDLKDAWTKLRTRPLRSLFSVLLCALIGCGTIPVISSQEAPNPTASDFRECFESRSSGSIGSFAVERGASVPDRSGTESEVDLDFATFVEGKASLRLRSIASDTTWYSAGMSLDPRLSQITVTYQVRGDSIASRWDPYNNAYVGIAVHRGDRVMFQGNSYEGSFDWRHDSLTIAIPEDSDIRSIRLAFFLSKPGTL
jgi:hypothetical protein